MIYDFLKPGHILCFGMGWRDIIPNTDYISINERGLIDVHRNDRVMYSDPLLNGRTEMYIYRTDKRLYPISPDTIPLLVRFEILRLRE